MGWEKRGKRLYYVHTFYPHGKKRRVYLGRHGDPVAELAATNAALDAIHRPLDERAHQTEVARLRDGPIIAGIDAMTAWAGRAFRGEQAAAADGPASAADRPETG